MESMRRLLVVASTMLFIIGAMASTAHATLLAPGGTVLVSSDDASGFILGDTGLEAFSFVTASGTNSGTVRELVVQDTLNPFGAGDLTFIMQVNQSTLSTEHVSGGDFDGFLTDVSQFIGHLPLNPGTMTAADAKRDLFGTVEFDFSTFLMPGSSTLAFLIRTNALAFTAGSIGIIDSGGETLPGFEPLSTVPEPGSMFLLGTGLIGGALRLRNRKKANKS